MNKYHQVNKISSYEDLDWPEEFLEAVKKQKKEKEENNAANVLTLVVIGLASAYFGIYYAIYLLR